MRLHEFREVATIALIHPGWGLHVLVASHIPVFVVIVDKASLALSCWQSVCSVLQISLTLHFSKCHTHQWFSLTRACVLTSWCSCCVFDVCLFRKQAKKRRKGLSVLTWKTEGEKAQGKIHPDLKVGHPGDRSGLPMSGISRFRQKGKHITVTKQEGRTAGSCFFYARGARAVLDVPQSIRAHAGPHREADQIAEIQAP